MQLLLTGRKVDTTPALKQLISRKLHKLERLLNDSAVSVQVVLSQQRRTRETDITLHARGDHILRGVGTAESWPASVKAAVEKIEQQAHTLKEKWNTRKRRAAGVKRLNDRVAEPPAPAEAAAPSAPGGPRVVRAARYDVKALSVRAAARRVVAGQRQFLVFRNVATDAINVLYRRSDGTLGLIDPGP